MCVAAETGARFVRERIMLEPIEWMIKPQRVLGNHTAFEACQSKEGFRRAIVFHGLSMKLDMAPEALDGIAETEFLSDAIKARLALKSSCFRLSFEHHECGPPMLYTSTISSAVGGGYIHVFAAMIARSPQEVRTRLRHRLGPLLEDQAVIRLGFDPSEPIACSMVSDAMAHLIELAEQYPASALADGFDFHAEQRFAA
jgi:hypothetical protein